MIKTVDLEATAKIGLVGDLMLDRYTIGQVDRVSPEAPVIVLRSEREKKMLGGAGNVLMGLKALGLEVLFLSTIGCDIVGDEMVSMLEESEVSLDYLFRDPLRITSEKHRMVASNQQLLRVDKENPTFLNPQIEQSIISQVSTYVKQIDVLAISDYGKGLMTPQLTDCLIQEAQKAKIPIVVDPKGIDYSKYKGATLIKPNLKEAYEAANMPLGSSLDLVAEKLFEITEAQYVMITKSEEGISLFSSHKQRLDVPAQLHEVKDVTGAGDTVLSVVTLGLANKLDFKSIMVLSNSAASVAIEKMGCVHVSKKQMLDRLYQAEHVLV